MNTLPKFMTIAFLAVSICISGLIADLASPQSSGAEPMVPLTAEEQAWLAEHPEIVLGASTNYPPHVIKLADGTHAGVLVDLFEDISRRLNTTVRLHIEDSWAGSQELAQNGEIDGLASAGRDPSRDATFNATDALYPSYFSVFALSQHIFRITSFSDLNGMRIGYKGAARPAKTLLEKLPSAILVPFDSNESMTQALLGKEIDLIVAWISYDHWRKNTLQGTIDKIYIIEDYPFEMVSYIRKDWPEFLPIINKALTALRQEELPHIINKWFGKWPQVSQAEKVSLTPDERAWLIRNSMVRVRITDLPPYQSVKDNESEQGVVFEYLKLIGDRTGIKFKYEVTGKPFVEFLDSMKQRKGPDMTALIVSTPEREEYISFSAPYISSPYVIFIREQDKPILDIRGLGEKALAVPRGFAVHQQLNRDYPEIRQVLFDSDADALEAVATGKVDAYIGNLAVASHIIHRRGFSSLQVTAAAPFKEQFLSMGNRKDWPELTSIINKALASITEDEKTAIFNKYLAIKFEQGINKAVVSKWVLIVGGSAMGIMLLFVIWNRRMSLEIKKRKQTERDLKQARDAAETANLAKNIFLASMSHELRTPLNAILGFSGMMSLEQNISVDQQHKLDIINRSGQHLLTMINDVLDLSKIEAEKIDLLEHPFDLVALIKEISLITQSRTTEKGLTLAVETKSISFPYVNGDAGKLRQILINLLNNAVKFTDAGGVIIRCGNAPVPDEPNRCHIVIEVEDTGLGIAPGRQAQIFEPFIQGTDQPQRKGTGLGLSICKSLSNLMGGSIEVESKVGQGSLFRVLLALRIAREADVRPPADDTLRVIGLASPPEQTWRILVVDDNRDNRLLLSSLLEEAGFVVDKAGNGKEAVEKFEKIAPALIWMDMRMPIMDGYEATKQIRQCPGGDTIPIIAITASAFGEQRAEILESGCNDMVAKPFVAHEIFKVMARYLELQYIYKEADASEEQTAPLSAEILAGIPAELLQELRETTLTLKREAATEVISHIAEHAPETATKLKKLVDNFQMAELQKLLK